MVLHQTEREKFKEILRQYKEKQKPKYIYEQKREIIFSYVYIKKVIISI
jgi:hypothetical protein